MFNTLQALRPWLDARDVRRVLLITGPGRRFVGRLQEPLEGLDVTIFDGAVVHVPEAVVAAAGESLAASEAEAIITLGGGAATGLGKALRLESDVPLVAVPTTYAGSEMTNIYGVKRGNEKQTGRDDRVRPALVIQEVDFTLDMPLRLTITSLCNALAHPVSALSTGTLDASAQDRAFVAIEALVEALQTLIARPHHRGGRQKALLGATRAGQVLDGGILGAHHKLAHFLGGRLDADHAALHAALLPHSLASLVTAGGEIAERLRGVDRDLPGLLFALLQRAGAPTDIAAVAEGADIERALADLATTDLPPHTHRWAVRAAYGRDPSLRFERLDLPEHDVAHVPAAGATRRVVVAIHGRGSTAESALSCVRTLIGDHPHTAVVAPQASENVWVRGSYRDNDAEAVSAALAVIDALIERAAAQVGRDNVALFGFSQGACLALEWLARTRAAIGGLVALSGARIGPRGDQAEIKVDLSGVRVVLGISQEDPWVDADDVRAAAETFTAAGAEVELLQRAGDAHVIDGLELIAARPVLTGEAGPPAQWGYGNAHHSEALPGALPTDQNSPRHAPYGLYPEQVNGSGFVAHRHQNLRCWMYRIRPSAQHTPLVPLAHPTLVGKFDGPPEPNLCGWAAPALPTAPTDFVDGLITVGGAGSGALRRGWAAHLYVANRSMDDRAFINADGDMLIIPQHGRLTVQTEMGVMDVPPGHIAVIPRGLKFSVLLPDGPARGYIGEVFGRHFELPERGPVGANGLSDPRHFKTPGAHFEDRLEPGYRLAVRYGGELFEAHQDFSPYDVVAWHGNYAPYSYDLMHFSPVGNTRFDHPDPSIYTVLTAPLDEVGSHNLDFVFFPPRWDPTEHTFRPPYFHRNATTEYNGIIQDPSLTRDSPFQPGCVFLTPSMTPHGVVARSVERNLAQSDAQADRPHRTGDRSMWFQFESALPLVLTPWAREAEHREDDWTDIWGVYKVHFDPSSGG